MASVSYEYGSDASVLTTELNTLANDANAISSAIDNSAGYLFDDLEFHNATLGYTPSAGARIEVYMISQELDGTGYEDGNASIDPPANNLVGVINVRVSTAAQTHIIRGIPLAENFKYLVINKTGGALPASGNTLRRKPYRYQTA